MRITIIKAAVLLAILLNPTNASSQTVYVIDHLAVGIHEDKALNSAIIRVLPTGTQLEVLERDENFVRIRTDDGVEGWVDSTYLMEDKPAQLALLELEATHVEALNELEVAKAEIESLTVALNSMESAEQIQESTEEATSEALREMQRLAEENQSLKHQLEEAKAMVANAATIQEVIITPVEAEPPREVRMNAWLGMSKWHWIMVVALMVLAFGIGGYLVDWGIRRRHGGFRV